MIFWAIVGFFTWFLGRAIYRSASERYPTNDGMEAIGGLLAAIGAIVLVVNVLRYAWSNLP